MLWAQINRSFPSVAGKPFYCMGRALRLRMLPGMTSTQLLIYFLFKTAESEGPKDYVVAL